MHHQSILRRGVAFALLALVATSGCIAIPYPHKVVPHSHITGRTVDAETGEPLPDMIVSLTSTPRIRRVTNADGFFEFAPQAEWRYFCIVWLLPVDFFYIRDSLEIAPTYGRYSDPHRWYTILVEVNSHAVPPIWAFSRPENLELHDHLGDIPIPRIPQISTR